MIEIKDKEKCCGCESCVNVCPKECISFEEDERGFRYPKADRSRCVECGLCEKVCPCLHVASPSIPLQTYGAVNEDQTTRLQSSSGGIFTLLAEHIIDQGGVVFGAAYDREWNVEHIGVSDKEGLQRLRGAKYVQSRIGNCLKEAKTLLEKGIPVMFSGTPCQIAGLRMYLRKDYELLTTVDIVCHSVPSPAVWRRYLRELNPEGEVITEVNLKDKSNGWARYGYNIRAGAKVLYSGPAANSDYLKGFNKDLFTRSSCFRCPAKSGRSGSDITLGDNWGYEITTPEITDDRGISAVMINTPKGDRLFGSITAWKKAIPFDVLVKFNPAYEHSAKRHKGRELFWKLFPEYGLGAVPLTFERTKPGVAERVWLKINKLLKK